MTTEEILMNGGWEELRNDEYYPTMSEKLMRLAKVLGGDICYNCPEEKREHIVEIIAQDWEAGESFLPHPEASMFAQMFGGIPREKDSAEEAIAAAKQAVEAMAKTNYRIWLAGIPRDKMQILINTIGEDGKIEYSGVTCKVSLIAADWCELHKGEEKVYFEHPRMYADF